MPTHKVKTPQRSAATTAHTILQRLHHRSDPSIHTPSHTKMKVDDLVIFRLVELQVSYRWIARREPPGMVHPVPPRKVGEGIRQHQRLKIVIGREDILVRDLGGIIRT